jgi:cyclomaltodextrinase
MQYRSKLQLYQYIVRVMSLYGPILDTEISSGPEWAKDAVFYQIFPDRFYNGDWGNDPPNLAKWGDVPRRDNFFGGDLKGVLQKLPYLKELGINAIWFNPIFDAPSNHKYDTRDYFRIDPSLGDIDAFKELLSGCHANQIRVILDGVFNHTGTEFFAFQDVKKYGSASKYSSWYHVHEFCRDGKPLEYDCWWGFRSLPELNTNNSEVQKYLFDVITYWSKEVGIDGWRLDVPNEVGHEFWREFRKLVKGIDPESYIVGEIWKDGSPWLQGDQFDGVMNYLFRDAMVSFFAHREIDACEFDERLAEIRQLYRPEVNHYLLNLLGSHDTARFLTVCHENIRKMAIAVIFQMTYVGIPLIYYGDEVGMTGHGDPDCRRTMIWDESQQNQRLLRLYQRLIRIRRSYPALRRGSFCTFCVEPSKGLYSFIREMPSHKVLVVLNNSNLTYNVELPVGSLGMPDGSKMVDLLSDTEYLIWGGKIVIPAVKPYCGGVFVQSML